MTYRIERIIFKDGTLLTERDLAVGENIFEGEVPVVGDIVSFNWRGLQLRTEIIWGHWAGSGPFPPERVARLRAQEI